MLQPVQQQGAGFPGRDDLEELFDVAVGLVAVQSWRGDTSTAEADHNPTLSSTRSAGLGGAHYDVKHGGRGLSCDDARSALTLLALWEVPQCLSVRAPAAASTTQQCKLMRQNAGCFRRCSQERNVAPAVFEPGAGRWRHSQRLR